VTAERGTRRAEGGLGRVPCLLSLVALSLVPALAPAQSRPDTLRGSWHTPGRHWWDVTHYDLSVRVSPSDSTLRGSNAITYRVTAEGQTLQIDLMTPLVLDSVVQDGVALPLEHEGNAHFAGIPAPQAIGSVHTATVYFHGRPRVAPRPPWDGGLTWATDTLGRPWIVTTDQGVGASIWWPNKDTQADEPDSMRVTITAPRGLQHIGAGRLVQRADHADGTTSWTWRIANPINNYAIALAVGHYAHWQETYRGEDGPLTMDYYPLDVNLERARAQFVQARSTMQCFEHWFGPYPFYEDGYKLIEVPNTGMEHQGAVTYGNRYANGYRGRDGSGTGLGMQWDFIIVHETAHEWWGNNITTRDLADMWVHESFANYSESIYTECLLGPEAGSRYNIGVRKGIRNDRPVIPATRGINAQGSGDMYPKGGAMLHTIRQVVANDAIWRDVLRGLNRVFRHRIVDGREVQEYIIQRTGIPLQPVFDQYLTTTQIPAFAWRTVAGGIEYRWEDVVPGFAMPVDVTTDGGRTLRLTPTTEWQRLDGARNVEVDADYYVVVKQVRGEG
jgi:aminopeptidase N